MTTALPQVGDSPATPIDIDPGVDYLLVIPVSGETSLAFTPVAGFAISLTGRTLTINFSGTAPALDATYSLPVTATNNAGETKKSFSIRVRGTGSQQATPSFFASATTSSSNFKYLSDGILGHAGAQPIKGRIIVGTKIKYVSNLPSFANTTSNVVLNTAYYIVSVNDAAGTFKISGSLGGSPIAPDGQVGAYFVIAAAVNTLPEIFIGDTTRLSVGQAGVFSYGDAAAIPSNFSGTKYIKTIVDAYRITVASTLGGSTVNSNADSFASDEQTTFNFTVSAGTRYFPAINSASEISVTEESAISDYTLAADIAPDSFGCLRLPTGLSFNAGTNKITGAPFNLAAQTRVILVAYKGSNASYRYLLLNRVGGGLTIAPDAIFDTGTRGFYSVSGIAGRADRINHQLNDPPIKWGFEENGVPLVIPAASIVRFWVKKLLTDSTTLASGSITLTIDREQFSLGEDWTAAALVALFSGGKDYVDLIAQIEVHFPTDAAGLYRKGRIKLRLFNDLSQAGTGATGTAPSVFLQSKPFSALTGGTSGALDTPATVNLAVDTWFAKTLRTVGSSKVSGDWALVAWDTVTADADEATSADRGIVIPDDFNPGTNAKMWARTQGL